MQATDDSDFTEFVAGSSRRLLGLAYLLTADRRAAENLLQLALERTYRRWHRLNREGVPQIYARRALVQLATARWRHHVGGMDSDLDGRRPDDVPDMAAGEAHAALIRAVAALTPNQRAVLALRYFEDLTDAEAAVVIGCSAGAVRSQHVRAMTRLRSLMPIGSL